MKLAVLRGDYLNPWEMRYYSKLKRFGIEPTGICSYNNQFSTSDLGINVIKLKSVRSVNKIPIVSKVIGGVFCCNNGLIGLKKKILEFDCVNTAETYNTYSYQAVKQKKPVVVTCWETIPFNNERTAYKLLKKTVRNKASHFIAITHKAKETLIKEGVYDEKISVIPAGLDTEHFKPAKNNLAKEYQLEGKKVVLFVGRLEKEKGITDLVKAMTGINAVLVIVGKGPLEQKIKEKCSKLEIDARFLGFVDYSKMPQIFNLCDVFCLPSIPNKRWEEQFGYVLVEAMSCAKQIVTTKSGAIPEVVGKHAFLVEPRDVLALREKILKGLEKGDNLNARDYVLEKYKDEVVARKLQKVFTNT